MIRLAVIVVLACGVLGGVGCANESESGNRAATGPSVEEQLAEAKRARVEQAVDLARRRGQRDGFRGRAKRQASRTYRRAWVAGHEKCGRDARRAIKQRRPSVLSKRAGCARADEARAAFAAMPRATLRVGARCSDGTDSEATGSGACSWHGGVDYWYTEEQIMSAADERELRAYEAEKRAREAEQVEREAKYERDRKRRETELDRELRRIDAESEERQREIEETLDQDYRIEYCPDGRIKIDTC